MFKNNVGATDRLIRGSLGVAALAYLALGTAPLRWFGLIGIVLLATAAMGTCPLYSVLGMSTCPVKRT